MTMPKVDHWIAANWMLGYVKGTLDFGILYHRSKDQVKPLLDELPSHKVNPSQTCFTTVTTSPSTTISDLRFMTVILGFPAKTLARTCGGNMVE